MTEMALMVLLWVYRHQLIGHLSICHMSSAFYTQKMEYYVQYEHAYGYKAGGVDE